MAEAPEQPDMPPEMKLLARLRLQRVVFGVLAAALVTGAALGLAAYRRMQTTVREADRAAVSARTDVAESNNRLEDIERQRAAARAEAESLSRALGLANARQAIHEARAGFKDRANELVQDSVRYGAPPWWPIANFAARDGALRFRGSLHPDAPVACGDVTPDGARLAVARNVPGACVVEIYDGTDGSLVGAGAPALAADRLPPLAESLLIDPSGKSLLLAAQNRLFHVEVSSTGLKFTEVQGGGARVQHMSASADFRTVLVCRGRDGLFLLTTGAQWNIRAVPTPKGDARAACFGGPGEIYLSDGDSLYRAREEGAFLPVVKLAFEPESVCVAPAGGGIALCARRAAEFEYFLLESPGDRVRQRARVELPSRADGALLMLADGTAMTGIGGGRVLEFRPGESTELSLGGYGPNFAGWHPLGMLFGNSHGDIGLRVGNGAPGMPLALLAPQLVARAHPYGFVTSSPDGDRTAWTLTRGHIPLPGASRVYFAGEQVALTSGDNSSLLGRTAAVPGLLLGAGKGGMLLWRAGEKDEVGSKLAVARENGQVIELACAAATPPDDVAVAPDLSAAVLRWQGTLFVTDLNSDPRPLGRRGEFSPDLMTISADGGTLAMCSGPAIVVRNLATNAERTLLAGSPPRALALLYAGTVVCSAENESLALYEVDGGRELARFAGTVTSMAATPQDQLLLVCNGKLRRLQFPTP